MQLNRRKTSDSKMKLEIEELKKKNSFLIDKLRNKKKNYEKLFQEKENVRLVSLINAKVIQIISGNPKKI